MKQKLSKPFLGTLMDDSRKIIEAAAQMLCAVLTILVNNVRKVRVLKRKNIT